MPESDKTILLVDDEEPVRESVRDTLRGDGYHILEAKDYEEAMSIHHEHLGEIDMLLTDLSLPGKNGCELAKALLEAKPNLTVLFMSGHAGAEMCRFYGLTVTDVHFLEKPFLTADLLQRVACALRWTKSTSGSASA